MWKIKGVSLHSHRYAWAERAHACDYPERWAQNALVHNSRAVHEAYAISTIALCMPLEQYEKGDSTADTEQHVNSPGTNHSRQRNRAVAE